MKARLQMSTLTNSRSKLGGAAIASSLITAAIIGGPKGANRLSRFYTQKLKRFSFGDSALMTAFG